MPMLMTKLPNKLKLIISRQFGKNIWEITEILNLFRNELEAREKIDIENNLSETKASYILSVTTGKNYTDNNLCKTARQQDSNQKYRENPKKIF